MTTAIVTGHVGYQWDRIATVTLPHLAHYASRHGYDLWDVPLEQYAEGRPASWGKAPALTRVLQEADLAVWIDTDVLVGPDAPPIHEAVPEGAWQALVFHDVPEGDIPNCGVWAVRPPMQSVLRQVWDSNLDHPWWEQAALMQLLGFDITTWPILAADRQPSALFDATTELSGGWNAHPHDRRLDLMEGAWFRHATPGNNRERLLMLHGWAKDWGL